MLTMCAMASSSSAITIFLRSTGSLLVIPPICRRRQRNHVVSLWVVLDPKVETTVLDNGLAVTTVALPHLHTAVSALFVKVRARFEQPTDSGLSHFVEHM